jgi:hypothetical protein
LDWNWQVGDQVGVGVGVGGGVDLRAIAGGRGGGEFALFFFLLRRVRERGELVLNFWFPVPFCLPRTPGRVLLLKGIRLLFGLANYKTNILQFLLEYKKGLLW